jgi:hypothetical protein
MGVRDDEPMVRPHARGRSGVGAARPINCLGALCFEVTLLPNHLEKSTLEF